MSPTAAYATDNPTYLGVIEVDCRDGRLSTQTIVFTGGVGDTFKLLSTSGDCTMPSTPVLTGEPASLIESTVSQDITIVSAGEFTITDAGNNDVTFRTYEGPVFGNHDRGNLPEFSVNFANGCNETVEVYYQAVADTFTLRNRSPYPFDLSDPDGVVANEPASVAAGATSGSLSVSKSGSFTASGTSDATGCTTTFLVLEGAQPDIGVGASQGDSFTYPDVFYSVATGVVDAKVTVSNVTNLDFEGNHDTPPDLKVDVVDESLSPASGNWALAPVIDVFGSSGNITNEGSATLTVEFFETGGTTPVTLSNLAVTVIDIDRGQFVSAPSVTSFQLSSSPPTELVASRSGDVLTVREPLGEGSSDDHQENWVVLNFDEARSLEFTVGAINGNGASFGLVFAPAPWSTTPITTDPATISLPATPSNSSPSSSTESSESLDQAIHLDLLATAGVNVASASALLEGQGLLPGSTYSLRLGPGGQSLKSGQVSRSGGFSYEVPLPLGLAPGNYFLELSATGRDGASLVLSQGFTVGPQGNITQVFPGKTGSGFHTGLAATGPSSSLPLSLSVVLVLLLFGAMSVGLSRKLRVSNH